MSLDNTQGNWEKRYHPLRQEWIVYSAHRNSRPWSGSSAKESIKANEYEPNCYLCPTNKRIHGDVNPDYKDVFIFDNDHPVVALSSPEIDSSFDTHDGLYIKEKANGIARVVCYDPRHNVTMSEMPLEKVAEVFYAWKDEMNNLANKEGIKYVLIFENKGEIVGVSNPHPHCQIYATDFVFNIIERELRASSEYRFQKGINLFEAIIKAEQKDQVRIIAENENAISFIPFFARYAYEVYIFPKKRHATLQSMNKQELYDLADVFQQTIRRFDMNFQMSFPYVMVMLQAPMDGKDYPDYHLHLNLLPPLRQPGLVKFLAGPESGGGNFMADTMPELKAAELRAIDLSLYKPM